MKAKNKYQSGCPDAASSNCVVWDGPSIPALEICNGDVLSDAVYTIAQKVVDLAAELDLSTLDLSCIIDLCSDCQEQKNLKNILQLLLENDCKLKELIDAILDDNSPQEVLINLNMKCLKKFDDFENEIPQDLNQTLQSIVNEVCTHRDDIVFLKDTVDDLQAQIDAIDVNPIVDEPLVTTCVASARPTSQAVVAVANDYCNFKTVVGTAVEIQQAIAKQGPELNDLLKTVDGWIIGVTDMAQSLNNLWITVMNHDSRINLIETNCCQISCKDIVIGIIITPNVDGDAISIKFASSMGTFIPTGFTDNGSVLSIIDQNGVSIEYPIIVSQDGVQGEFSFIGLDTSAPLTASISAKLQSDTLGCEKCVAKQFIPSSTCPVCEVRNTGSKGTITITYQTL